MPSGNGTFRGSLFGPLLLILLGGLFLYATLREDFSAWRFLARYWPVLIILWGVAKLIDHFRLLGQPGIAGVSGLTGGDIVGLVFLLLLGTFLSHSVRGDWWSGEVGGPTQRETRSMERGGAETVDVAISLGAGQLRLAGGAPRLLEAEFAYNVAAWKPEVVYDVIGSHGKLSIRQPSRGRVTFGRTRNEWDLRLANDVPLNLEVRLGAGESRLVLGGLALKRLEVEIGVGGVTVDLTGNWKQDFNARIAGGVGHATVRLPREVGVRVRAKGGIGKISARGLKWDGDAYVNDAYGRSPVTLNVEVAGGIGHIELEG